ncbi:MAG: phosphoribosylglycinamide formyltransferase [Hydrocarboniphaga sp.]|uniref:phosphoribosylglycinamide formyltransferase n=1 Tax=Hydrocarboniphaga sp. TaxID=2033016 RepID=UPI0026152E6D|nr:phosphoribosylglycinamide formyltransferase [Hydrocarboniphaga sp.]MDB5969644.1 phosphoribosylglycinamide formyltransferase [Hydrocarboniphaga sp.]
MKRLVVLISGRGRNLQALIEATRSGALPAEIALVVSNRADAQGLGLAEAAGIATHVLPHTAYPNREAFDAELLRIVVAAKPDLVALAGFMRILTPVFISAFEGRLLNIHPSLLPRHRGLNTHARALAAGDTEHGATVHFVTQQLDEGPPILQGRIPIHPDDTAETLAERVLEEVELKIYPQAIAGLLQ